MSLLRRSVPTLRSISVTTAVRLVGVIALLGVVTTGVTQYQRHLFEQSTTAVEEASRALGAVDRALIESAGLMLEVLYRPRDGEGLESRLADYRAASDRADGAFRRAAEVLAGTGAASELELARATWDDVDAVVCASPGEWTNKMIYAAVESNADPWVATVWAPYDEMNQQMASVRAATVDELQQQSVEVASIQRVLVVVVLLALVVSVLLSVLTLRRVSRQVLEPLARVGVSARSLHTPEGYRPAEVPGAVAEVRALAATIDQTASSLHVHHSSSTGTSSRTSASPSRSTDSRTNSWCSRSPRQRR